MLVLTLVASAPVLLFAQTGTLAQRLDALASDSYSMPANQALAALRQLSPEPPEDPGERARYRLLLARLLAQSGDAGRALDSLEALIEPAESPPAPFRLRALNLAAETLISLELFDLGFEYFRQALELAPKTGDAQAQAGTWNLAAELFNRTGEYTTALEYAHNALNAVTDHPELREYCVARLRRAEALDGLERGAQAIAAWHAAVRNCGRLPHRRSTGQAWLGLAGTLRAANGRADERIAALVAAQAEFRAVDDRAGLLEAATRRAGLLLETAGADQARRVMADAPPAELDNASPDVRAAAHAVQARLARQQGRDAQAFDHARRAVELERRLAEHTREMRIGLLLSEQQHQVSAHELQSLGAQQQIDELDAAGRRQQLTSGSLLAGAAVTCGGLLLGLLVTVTRDRNRLKRRMRCDALTDLLNHTGFFDSAEESFRQARVGGWPFTLVVADLDRFKQINDQYGHLTGDAVLQRVADRLKHSMGGNALIGRLGGEEFGIALPRADIDQAVALIERFRAALNQERGDTPHVSLSFGVAERGREPSLDVLYAHADQALYDAKETGRNRVVTVARLQLGSGAFVT